MKCYVRGYNGRGRGSALVRWFTFGKYSHVSIVIVIRGKAWEFESLQGKGVIKHEPNEGSNFVEYEVPLTEEQVLEVYILACTTASCDTKYDWSGIWGFMIRKDKHSDHKFFCSEFVAWLLWKVGYKLSRREPYRETPTSVMESLRLIAPAPEVGNA